MVNDIHEASQKRKSGMYAKGAARRELLIDQAAELLCRRPLGEISLKMIAKAADVPVGSAYHFYNNAAEVFTALAQRFSRELNDIISAPYIGSCTQSWQLMFEEAVDRGVRLYNEVPAYRHLIIGGKTPPEIKLADRVNDERIGEILEEVISRHFEFPVFPKHREVFFHATEIVDLMLSLSMIKYGEITQEMVQEAKKAAKAYLREYMPQELTRRST